MKKRLSFIIIRFFICILCHAQSKPSLSISPHMGFTFGQFDEILYDSNGNQCSLLEWEQKPLLNIGFSMALALQRFSITTSFEYGTKLGNPYMTDSDWNSGEKYSVTRHPLESSKELNTQFLLTYNLISDKRLNIFPEIELQYMYDSFNAGKGSGIRDGRKINVYGVDYTKHSLFIFTGYNLGINLSSYLKLNTDFFISPFVYQYDIDFHHGVINPFTSIDIQQGAFTKFKINANLELKCTDTFKINFYTQFLFGYINQGAFYSNYYTEEITKFDDQKSGSNLYSIKFGIGTTSLHF